MTPQKNLTSPQNTQREKAKREISAGFIVYRRTQEGTKFLILYHGRDYWNFPKGHIENEEDALQAAYRETQEEAGLAPRDLHIKKGFKAYERFYFRREKQGIFKIVIFYLAETRNPIVKISKEHQGYGWFLFPYAKRILGKHPDSQKVLMQAHDFLLHSKNPNAQPIQGSRPQGSRPNPPRPNPHV